MSLVQMVSDFNGNVEINGVTYLSSSIQVSVNEENSDAINMKYFKDFIVFNVNYSDFEYGVTLGGVTVFQSAGNTLQEVLDRIDILLDDSIFKGTVAALAGAFPNSSGSYSGRAIHAVGESYLGGQVDVDGGLSVSSGNSTLNNFSVNNYAVFNTGTQTAQGGEIRLAQAVQNHVGQGGTDTAYYTKVRGAASLNNHVVVNLPSVPIPNSGGPYAIVQDPLTGNASWADTSTFGGGGGLWTQTGNDIYYNTGNVGIGTTNPTESLQIGQPAAGSSQTDHHILLTGYDVAGIKWNMHDGWSKAKLTSDLGGNINFINEGSVAKETSFNIGSNYNYLSENEGRVWIKNSGVGNALTFGRNGPYPIATVRVDATGGAASYFGGLTFNVRESTTVTHDTLTLEKTGKVGIGTTTPSEKLHVEGNIFMSEGSKLMSETTDPVSGAQSQSLEFYLPYRSDGVTMAENRSALKLGGHKFFEPRTTNTSTLHVFGGLQIVPTNSVDSAGSLGIGFGSSSDQHPSTSVSLGGWANFAQTNDRHFKNYGYFGIRFEANGARYDTDGQSLGEFNTTGLGIGTNSPSEKLHVVGNVVVDSGNSNMFIGDSTTGDSITGEKNIAIGESAMRAASATSQYGIAIGSEAARYGGHDHGMSIGFSAGHNGASGSAYVGSTAGKMAAGQRNVGIGYASGGGFSNGVQNLFGNVSIGYAAGSVLETAATAVGYGALTALTTGGQNTAIGYQASSVLTTQSNVTAIGYQAGQNATTANNVYIGTNAGKNYNTGDQAVIIGYNAGYVNANGQHNVFIGGNTGSQAAGSERNVAIGMSAGYFLGGNENVLLGGYAGQGSGASNFSKTVAVGHQALSVLTTGTGNTAVGYQAGDAATTGYDNTLLGYNSGGSIVGGYNNTGIGKDTLSTLTSGYSNTAVGLSAVAGGVANTGVGVSSLNGVSGIWNTALGMQAGYSLTGENYGTFVGGRSGRYTTGGSNTLVGYESGQGSSGVSTFSNTTAVGYQALTSLTTGTGNTALGYQALLSATTNQRNTAVGQQTLKNTTAGSDNTAVGFQSLIAVTSGNYNTALGFAAGDTLTTGSNNTLIGHGAGSSLLNHSGNVMIGYNAGYNETGSNKLYIENSNSTTPLIYGEFDNDILRVNGTLQVGDPTGTGFALPSTDGTANQVLSTDGAGTVSWVDQSGGGGGASTLNDLTDVIIPSVADGDLLNYNSAFSSWIPVNSISLAGNITSAAIVQGNTGSFTTTTSESYKFVGTGDFSIEPATTLGGDLYIKSNKDIIVEIDTNNNDTPSKFSVVDGTERFSVDDAGVARFNNAFSLPNADGTTGQVLSTDGSGAVTWVDQGAGSSDADIQLAYKTTDQTLTTTFTAITAWDGEYYDDQTAFDPTTGTLTITQAGTYFIQADVVTYCTVGSSRSSSEVYLEFNGGEIGGSRRGMYNRLADNGTTSASIAFPYKHTTGTATFKLVAGQTAGSDTVVVSNAFFSSVTLGGAAGAQGISGDAFQVAGETSGRTLVAGDHLNYIRNTSATAVTYTVPPQSSVAWVDNAEVVFEQAGTGQITIAAGAGVTINSSETLKSGQQYAVIGLKRVASDTWTLTGERESA